MNPALRYLAARSLGNAARRTLGALRRPSRALGLLAGLAYLAWLASQLGRGPAPDPRQTERLGAMGLAVLAAAAWVFGGVASRSGSWRSLLFPAPIRDRDLVMLSLLASQAVVLPNVVLWLLLGARGATPLALAQRTPALWTLFTTVALHRALVARVRGRGRGPRWLGGAVRGLGLTLLAAIPFLMTGAFDLETGRVASLQPGPIGTAVLAPFGWVVRPLTAPSTGAWARALGPALPLPHRGGGTALSAWRSVTAVARRGAFGRWGVALAAATLALLAAKAGRSRPAAEFAGFLALTWAPIVLLLGPQLLRIGLRRDAERLVMLRTLPVRGRSLLLGNALAGAILAAGLALSLLALAVIGAGDSTDLALSWTERMAVLLGVVLVSPSLAALATLIQDAILICFPGPLSLGSPQPGATRLGTTLLNSVMSLGALLLLLAPAAAVAALLWSLGPSTVIVRTGLAALGASVVIAGVVLSGARWLGAVLERVNRS
jgi:hypothetical protein